MKTFFRSYDTDESTIRRNLNSSKILTDYDVTARQMADRMAKKLVERALEKDRQKIVRRFQRRTKDVTTLENDVEGECFVTSVTRLGDFDISWRLIDLQN